MGELIDSWGNRYTFNDDDVTKQKVFDRVMDYFLKYECFCGESIHQSDDPLIYAPNVMSDIADDILQFKYKGDNE